MKRIFISSTYIDLIPYREKIWELLQSFDVHISGMEKFGARKESALKTCLDEVSKSDIYIGIIGIRFGSVDKKTQKSFTQIEYEKAIEWLIIIAYRFGEPFEIFYATRAAVYIPNYVKKGWIIKSNEDTPARYDFQFDDNNDEYKITVEGIHRMCRNHLLLITKLTPLGVPIKKIIEIFKEIKIENEDVTYEVIKATEELIIKK